MASSSVEHDVPSPSRRRLLIAYAAVIAVVAALYQRGNIAVDGLYDRALARIEHWAGLDAALTQPGTGLEQMDANVMAAVGLLKTFEVPDFRIAKGLGFGGGGYPRQRIGEIAWPIPYTGASKFLLRLQNEDDRCATTLGTAAEVALDRCD